MSSITPDYGKKYDHNVMFLCTHNSCRSQMADAFLRQFRQDNPDASIGVASAGIEGGTNVRPGAATVMSEVGVHNLLEYTSNGMSEFNAKDFDIVISCCGCGSKLDGDKEVWKKRPMFEDWALDDPPKIDPGDLSEYRRVRDEIKQRVLNLLEFIIEE